MKSNVIEDVQLMEKQTDERSKKMEEPQIQTSSKKIAIFIRKRPMLS